MKFALLLLGYAIAAPLYMASTLGAKTDYGDNLMRTLLTAVGEEVALSAQDPETDVTTIAEPTCYNRFAECSMSYFGNTYKFRHIYEGEIYAVWAQDVAPFSCHADEGCSMNHESSTANLTSTTKGWFVSATLAGKVMPAPGAEVGAGVKVTYSNDVTQSITNTKSVTSSNRCQKGNMCFLETGTVMMRLTGVCKPNPLIVCSSNIYPCEDWDTYYNSCSQWADFTLSHCHPNGAPKDSDQTCSFVVPIKQYDGQPLSIQAFEQRPLVQKRDTSSEFPDGSFGDYTQW